MGPERSPVRLGRLSAALAEAKANPHVPTPLTLEQARLVKLFNADPGAAEFAARIVEAMLPVQDRKFLTRSIPFQAQGFGLLL